MMVECDWCGLQFKRKPSQVARGARHYCCREHKGLASRQGTDVRWLNAASDNDELYLVNRILQVVADMKKVELFSPEWEKLSDRHSLLLDITRDVLWINGKLKQSEEGQPWSRG